MTKRPDHKTSPLARLTPHGQQVLESINRTADRSHRAILEHFSDRQARELRKLLRAFSEAARDAQPDV